MSDYIYWLWLSLSGGPATHGYSLLLEYFGNAKSIYEADIEQYSKIDGLEKRLAKALMNKKLDKAKEVLEFCESHSVRLLHCMEPDYPVKLKWIYAYPALLYVYGTLPNLNENLTVAVVGTRDFTDYGKMAAYKIGGGLAKAKAVVISGLAKGNDSFAHLGCLANSGKTIAVMGCGIDRIYPSEHRELAKLISKNGAIVTEYAPGTKPLRHNFPQRNRIISGLSDAVVLVESTEKSGALITTKFATEQNRNVYAVPGDITSPSSYGPLSLMKDGAKPVSTAYDIVEDFTGRYSYLNSVIDSVNFDIPVPSVIDTTLGTIEQVSEEKGGLFGIKRKNRKTVEKSPVIVSKPSEPWQDEPIDAALIRDNTEKTEEVCTGLNEIEKKIFLKIAKADKINAEELIDEELDTSKVMSVLTKLEISGLIKALPGGFYTNTL